MEEDIEVIKKYIEYDKEHRIVTVFDEKPLFRDRLENLLTRYKEIKTEHKIMKRILVEHNLWETLLNDGEFIKYLKEE